MILGRIFRFGRHDSETSSGPDDDKPLVAPEKTNAAIVSVESAPVRVSFDGERPSSSHGILLPPGIHFLPFAQSLLFVSAYEEEAAVSVIWLEASED
jgi:hypothetical protein